MATCFHLSNRAYSAPKWSFLMLVTLVSLGVAIIASAQTTLWYSVDGQIKAVDSYYSDGKGFSAITVYQDFSLDDFDECLGKYNLISWGASAGNAVTGVRNALMYTQTPGIDIAISLYVHEGDIQDFDPCHSFSVFNHFSGGGYHFKNTELNDRFETEILWLYGINLPETNLRVFE